MSKQVLVLLLLASAGCVSSSDAYRDLWIGPFAGKVVRYFPSEHAAVVTLPNGDVIVGKVRIVDLGGHRTVPGLQVGRRDSLPEPPVILCFGVEVTILKCEYSMGYVNSPGTMLARLADPDEGTSGRLVSGGAPRFEKTLIARDESGLIMLNRTSESDLTVSYCGVAVAVWPVREGTIGRRLGRARLRLLERKYRQGVLSVWEYMRLVSWDQMYDEQSKDCGREP